MKMKLLEVKKGYYINPSHIVSIYYEATDTVTVTLSTGESDTKQGRKPVSGECF
ncbi:hypothetical protein [Escherichia coli]|nr:hypothetical protein [Escherichia coli]MDU9576032.1 hypothetical protein [Escherichia coli]MDU9683672.1 hypothetical protein [Escherichia coli]